MKSRTIGVLTAVLFFGISACGARTKKAVDNRFTIEFQTTNDDGQALSGVAIDAGRTRIGTTDISGLLMAKLAGVEGDTVPITVSCPDGFANPETMDPLRLTRTRRINLADYQPLRVEAICRRSTRNIVVVVRALEGAELPVFVEGKPAGVTDGDGIAHVLVRAHRDTTSIAVTLDTGAQPALKPKNPSRIFELSGNDAVLVFDQTFVSSRKPSFRVVEPKPRKHIPYRVD